MNNPEKHSKEKDLEEGELTSDYQNSKTVKSEELDDMVARVGSLTTAGVNEQATDQDQHRPIILADVSSKKRPLFTLP